MSPAADGPAGLALGLRQPVGTFDVAGVPAFEREISAFAGVASASFSHTRQWILLRPPIASRNMPTETRCIDSEREIQL